MAKVEAAACMRNDWPALQRSHKLLVKPAWPGLTLVTGTHSTKRVPGSIQAFAGSALEQQLEHL